MALENILVVFGYIAKYLPTLLTWMKAAEDTKESGEVKKSMVTGVVKSAVKIAADESTGGAKESWDRIEEPISMAIDAVATAVFGSKESIVFDEHEDQGN